jgi:hypothetical protein
MNTSIIPDEVLKKRIFFIRDQKVMLDHDLALLYEVETKALKQAVKRNMERFPEDFMFEMTKKEFAQIKNELSNTERDNHGGQRYLPYCFTEPGIAMLSSILKSDRAIQVNIQIIRMFIRMRQLLSENHELVMEIERIKKELHHQGKNIELVFQYLDELARKITEPIPGPPRKQIGYKPDNH